ncbi:MAG TPA: Ig-like domain-containing protein [Gemmatimonadaceae bacterium]|nr:Ig-like domain-containing protein [Gemmatimonadaceae bacterium]
MALVASCLEPIGPTVTSVVVRAPMDSLLYGDSLRIVAIATGDSAAVANPQFTWTSSDTTVAVVDSLGTVLGVSPGVATISAQLGPFSDEFTVRVMLSRFDAGVAFETMSRGFWRPLCALSVTGAPYCADEDATDPTPFAPLPKNGDLVFTSFNTSEDSRCGLTNAGLMYCWGQADHGHWGNGMPSSFRSDTAPSLGAGGRTFIALSVGGHSHTCGVNAADSVVYCFGHDDLNQVGRGSPLANDTVVAPTGGAPKGIAVTAEDHRNCLIGLDRALICWGQQVATPTPVPTPEPMAEVLTGRPHTCALAVTRKLYCWGTNTAGQLGVGNTSSASTPTLVAGNLEFTFFASTELATCAITSDGALYCWGDFHPLAVSSRLGAARYTPVRILPQYRFKSYAATTYACGITTDGQLFCWQ